ncbi:SpdD protein [Streptomyces marinisediminis]|uniref:SpdD protein n=1 Tax=Streptomyces TaxID=1883 RepID=UPI003A4C638D
MFRPQLPSAPRPTLVRHAEAASPCGCQHAPTPVRPSTGSLLASPRTGAVAAVLLGGVVLTALLAAVAVTALSVAVATVVLRSLLASQRRR